MGLGPERVAQNLGAGMRKDRLDGIGLAALLGVTLLLAINQIVVKEVNHGLQPVFFAGARSALAIVFVEPFILLILGRVIFGDEVGPRRIAASAAEKTSQSEKKRGGEGERLLEPLVEGLLLLLLEKNSALAWPGWHESCVISSSAWESSAEDETSPPSES